MGWQVLLLVMGVVLAFQTRSIHMVVLNTLALNIVWVFGWFSLGFTKLYYTLAFFGRFCVLLPKPKQFNESRHLGVMVYSYFVFVLLLDPKRANDQSHTTVLRLKQNQWQKQTESEEAKDLIQPQEKQKNPQSNSQF